jgi:hypothetical protein
LRPVAKLHPQDGDLLLQCGISPLPGGHYPIPKPRVRRPSALDLPLSDYTLLLHGLTRIMQGGSMGKDIETSEGHIVIRAITQPRGYSSSPNSA